MEGIADDGNNPNNCFDGGGHDKAEVARHHHCWMALPLLSHQRRTKEKKAADSLLIPSLLEGIDDG